MVDVGEGETGQENVVDVGSATGFVAVGADAEAEPLWIIKWSSTKGVVRSLPSYRTVMRCFPCVREAFQKIAGYIRSYLHRAPNPAG